MFTVALAHWNASCFAWHTDKISNRAHNIFSCVSFCMPFSMRFFLYASFYVSLFRPRLFLCVPHFQFGLRLLSTNQFFTLHKCKQNMFRSWISRIERNSTEHRIKRKDLCTTMIDASSIIDLTYSGFVRTHCSIGSFCDGHLPRGLHILCTTYFPPKWHLRKIHHQFGYFYLLQMPLLTSQCDPRHCSNGSHSKFSPLQNAKNQFHCGMDYLVRVWMNIVSCNENTDPTKRTEDAYKIDKSNFWTSKINMSDFDGLFRRTKHSNWFWFWCIAMRTPSQ